MGKKVLISTFTVALVTALLLAGCQTMKISESSKEKNEASSSVSNKNFPANLENPNVSVLVWGDSVQEEFTEAAPEFEKRYGGKVNFTRTTSNEMNTKIVSAISSGDPYDMINWNENYMPSYAIKGVTQPINDYYDFNDAMWIDALDKMKQYSINGKYYGVPRDVQPLMIVFNKTMFENNGMKTPFEHYKEGNWNWETFRKAATDLTQDTNRDGAVDQWGFEIFGAVELHFIASNGSDLVSIENDESVKLNLQDPKVIEALQFYQDLSYKYKAIPPKVGAWATEFQAGKLAMIVQRTTYIMETIKDTMKDQWDIAPFPDSPSGTKGVSPGTIGFWGISNGAKNPQGAAALTSLYFRYNSSNREEKLSQCFTPDQIKMIIDLSKRTKGMKYSGIGNMRQRVGPFKNEMKKGQPITGLIEKYTPIFQAEIDLMFKD